MVMVMYMVIVIVMFMYMVIVIVIVMVYGNVYIISYLFFDFYRNIDFIWVGISSNYFYSTRFMIYSYGLIYSLLVMIL